MREKTHMLRADVMVVFEVRQSIHGDQERTLEENGIIEFFVGIGEHGKPVRAWRGLSYNL